MTKGHTVRSASYPVNLSSSSLAHAVSILSFVKTLDLRGGSSSFQKSRFARSGRQEEGKRHISSFSLPKFYILHSKFYIRKRPVCLCGSYVSAPRRGPKKDKNTKRTSKKEPYGSFFVSAISSTASFARCPSCLSAGTPALLPRIPRPRRGFAGTLAEKAPKGPGCSPAHRQRGATCARLGGSSRARAGAGACRCA